MLEPITPPSPNVPSVAFRTFFRNVPPGKSFLHLPTFSSNEQAPLLLIAICAAGAQSIGTAPAQLFAERIFNRIDVVLQGMLTQGGESCQWLDILLVAMMLQSHRLFTGDSRNFAAALAMHGAVITFARRNRLFHRQGPCAWDWDQIRTEDQSALEDRWREWVHSETATRYEMSPRPCSRAEQSGQDRLLIGPPRTLHAYHCVR